MIAYSAMVLSGSVRVRTTPSVSGSPRSPLPVAMNAISRS